MLGSTLDFIVVSLVLFLVTVKLMGALRHEQKHDPTSKKCPECLEEIPLAAKRCRACASPVPAGPLGV